MISAADLRRQRRDLNRFRGTRETNLLGRVVVNGHEEMGSGSVVVTTDEATGGGRTEELEAELVEGEADASVLLQKARWMMHRNKLGDGFQCGPDDAPLIGVFVLDRAKHERHYDQVAFLLHRDCRVMQIDAKDVASGVLNTLRVVVFPGASIFEQNSILGEENHLRVARWVHDQGGAYLGMCSGGFLASQDGFHGADERKKLVNLQTSWTPGLGEARVELTSAGREWFGASHVPETLYFANGPRFKLPNFGERSEGYRLLKLDHGPVEPLLMYTKINTPQARNQVDFGGFNVAAFRTTFGRGEIVAIGPHPESSAGWEKPFRTLILRMVHSN